MSRGELLVELVVFGGRLIGADDGVTIQSRRVLAGRVDGAVGEEVLLWLARIGGEFVAENCYPLHVCERLHLPMAPKRAGALPRAM